MKSESQPDVSTGFYRFDIAAISRTAELLLIRASIGRDEVTFRYPPLRNGARMVNPAVGTGASAGSRLAKITAIDDTLKITAAGYAAKSTAITPRRREGRQRLGYRIQPGSSSRSSEQSIMS